VALIVAVVEEPILRLLGDIKGSLKGHIGGAKRCQRRSD
jgi:hypothetical protein